MKNKLSIIEVLESVRETQGMTQAELARKAGTSRVTVGRIEAGFDPKLSTLYELARALGLELTLVPKSLAGEVQAFLRSGGRSLAQPAGASAPPSVVDLAAVKTARPRPNTDLTTKARQVPQKVPHATGGPQPSTSSNQASLQAGNSAVNRSVKPLNPAPLTGKPMISESAARALGLNPPRKTGKDNPNTKRHP